MYRKLEFHPHLSSLTLTAKYCKNIYIPCYLRYLPFLGDGEYIEYTGIHNDSHESCFGDVKLLRLIMLCNRGYKALIEEHVK